MSSKSSQLRLLARLYGIETAYYDARNHRRAASPRALIEILKAMGVSPINTSNLSSEFRRRLSEISSRMVEPVTVSWNGRRPAVELRFQANMAEESVRCQLILEEGKTKAWTVKISGLKSLRTQVTYSSNFISKHLVLPCDIPLGYHKLLLETDAMVGETTLISAPMKAYQPKRERRWGVFIPLYALRSESNWGIGDFTDLERLITWTYNLGGGTVATLPLLPSFLDEPYDPSPYSPISRLFWNELYIDVTRAPEMRKCPKAQSILSLPESSEEIKEARASEVVEYRQVLQLKRRILEELARCFFSKRSTRYREFENFIALNPEINDYAKFRAAYEHFRSPWTKWPKRADNYSSLGDHDDSVRYYLYSQWLAHEQMREIVDESRKMGVYLYLDFPLGVHPEGFDAWRWRDLFVKAVLVGCPPDPYFPKGQSWGFNPPHPEKLREQRYSYYIESLRHHMRYSRILRIDHVMSLHRLFWIPKGLEPIEGVYVNYRAEEPYAILCLESHRNRCVIVGENLGTVPHEVDRSMARHGIFQMYVLQYHISPHPTHPFGNIPSNSIASLNTHDMPTFAGFLKGLDIDGRVEAGLLDSTLVREERRERTAVKLALLNFLKREGRVRRKKTLQEIVRECMRFLAASRAWMVLINLEDLWLEHRPQNMPGAGSKFPNWRRKARLGLGELSKDEKILSMLRDVGTIRAER